MNNSKHSYAQPLRPAQTLYPMRIALMMVGLASLVTGCSNSVALVSSAKAQTKPSPLPTGTATATPTGTSTATPIPTPTLTLTPSPTPWFSPTPLPTATPWSMPPAWQPARSLPTLQVSLPALTPMPVVVAGIVAQGQGVPISYSPPDEVDVFGNVILRWEYGGELAEDEFFDIKIKPAGSQNSAFVDWSKTRSYELRPWSGWMPGLYTWQIGIVKGYLEGESKHFIADTGRDSTPFIIKWQTAGGGGGNGGGNSGGSNGGGNNSGGS